ncbi:hypothetical protein R1sor_001455 [Riccia sorocarpa]|uniref:Uncharacterized protein n=1 Tax=Riccia sorocarpa TaxID=122646 RepID=A0ABD3GW20_9MARC
MTATSGPTKLPIPVSGFKTVGPFSSSSSAWTSTLGDDKPVFVLSYGAADMPSIMPPVVCSSNNIASSDDEASSGSFDESLAISYPNLSVTSVSSCPIDKSVEVGVDSLFKGDSSVIVTDVTDNGDFCCSSTNDNRANTLSSCEAVDSSNDDVFLQTDHESGSDDFPTYEVALPGGGTLNGDADPATGGTSFSRSMGVVADTVASRSTGDYLISNRAGGLNDAPSSSLVRDIIPFQPNQLTRGQDGNQSTTGNPSFPYFQVTGGKTIIWISQTDFIVDPGIKITEIDEAVRNPKMLGKKSQYTIFAGSGIVTPQGSWTLDTKRREQNVRGVRGANVNQLH